MMFVFAKDYLFKCLDVFDCLRGALEKGGSLAMRLIDRKLELSPSSRIAMPHNNIFLPMSPAHVSYPYFA